MIALLCLSLNAHRAQHKYLQLLIFGVVVESHQFANLETSIANARIMLENHYIVSARWVRPLSPAMRERTPPMITTCKPQDTNSSQATLRSAKLHSPADGSSQHQKFGSGCLRMWGCACAGCGPREPRPRYTLGTRNGHQFFIRANSCVMILRHLLTNPE